MIHDYFVVGPSLLLKGMASSGGAEELTMEAWRGRAQVAHLRARLREETAVLQLDTPGMGAISESDLIEMMRLFARVAIGFWNYRVPIQVVFADVAGSSVNDALVADGFTSADNLTWSRSPAPFVRSQPKAVTMEGVYGDLFSVPWNFVPREWDVLERVIRDAPTGSLRILDLGAGVGKNVEPFDNLGHRVFGVEPSPSAVRRCKNLVAHPERFLVGSADHLPWRSASFDRVLDVGCLHCMPAADRPRAIDEIARVLKPNGLLYSRFFKPRPASWLRHQPFESTSFGLQVDEVRQLLGAALVCDSLTDDGNVIYATSRKA